eukprot:TRINITY_DN1550_c0_g1_i2.p1 TRINITY_DN1550_c0_g1~~TRINITY_DN1550_c0_g1_i2.p1  ORF type:complete len:348 (-),score=94.84 TRINITY_DN1550_c0_g1_i2:89-1132(-)
MVYYPNRRAGEQPPPQFGSGFSHPGSSAQRGPYGGSYGFSQPQQHHMPEQYGAPYRQSPQYHQPYNTTPYKQPYRAANYRSPANRPPVKTHQNPRIVRTQVEAAKVLKKTVPVTPQKTIVPAKKSPIKEKPAAPVTTDDLKSVKEKIDELEKKRPIAADEAGALETEYANIESELKVAKESQTKAKKSVHEIDIKIGFLPGNLEALKTRQANLTKSIAAKEERRKTLQKQLDTLNADLLSLQEKKNEIPENMETVTSLKAELSSSLKTAKEERTAADSSVTALSNKKKELDARLYAQRAWQKELEREKAAFHLGEEKMRKKYEDALQNAMKLREELKSIESQGEAED